MKTYAYVLLPMYTAFLAQFTPNRSTQTPASGSGTSVAPPCFVGMEVAGEEISDRQSQVLWG